jgi:hypothetical protein
MTNVAYEWIERAIDKHFRRKAFQQRYDYAGVLKFNHGKYHNYQGDVTVIVIAPGGEWGFERPTVRVDVYFGQSTDDYKVAYDEYAEVVLRFRIDGMMKPGKGIVDYIRSNLLPLEVGGELEIGM